MSEFELQRNALGRLVLTDRAGLQHEGVVPVHAFPLTAPQQGTSLLSQDGHELAWIERLDELPQAARQLIEEEFLQREFMPEISRISKVSTYATPSVWEVETSRGNTSLILKGEEDIRRLGKASLLIADSNGIHFLVRNVQLLDKNSRRILDRFL